MYQQIELLKKKAENFQESMKLRQENLQEQLKESKHQIEYISKQYNQFEQVFMRCKRWVGHGNSSLNDSNKNKKKEKKSRNKNKNKNKDSGDDESENKVSDGDSGWLNILENEFDRMKYSTLGGKCNNISNSKNWSNDEKVEYLQNAIKFVMHNKMTKQFDNIKVNVKNKNNSENNKSNDNKIDINKKRNEIREKMFKKSQIYCERVSGLHFHGKELNSLNARVLEFNDIKLKDGISIVMFLKRQFVNSNDNSETGETRETRETRGSFDSDDDNDNDNDEDDSSKGKCIVCVLRNANMVYSCGHLSLCYGCYQEWSVDSKFCPDCMSKETDEKKAIKVYIKSGSGLDN